MPKQDPNQFLGGEEYFELKIKTEDPTEKLLNHRIPEFDSEGQG